MKIRKSLLISVGVLLVIVVLTAFVCNAVKTYDEIADMLQKELLLTEEEAARLSYVGEFTDGDESLLWFTVQNGTPYTNFYIAVECRAVADGRYLVKSICEGGPWGPDISHAFLGRKEIILIHNPSCRSVIFATMDGTEVSRIDISADDIPCIFELDQPATSTNIAFVDADGNELR